MKVKRFFHGTGILLLAIAGSAVLVFLLSTITSMLTVFDRSAASFLPAESTIALLHNPTRENSDLIPELRDMINVEVAALLTVSDEKNVPVFFIRADNHSQESSSTIGLGAYRVASPSQELLKQLEMGVSSPLSDDQAYKQLGTGRGRSSSWTFMKRGVLPPTEDLPGQLTEGLLFQQASAFVITREDDALSITLFGNENPITQGVALPPMSQSGDILYFNLQKGRHALQQTMGNMDEENQSILKGTLEKLLQEGFGESVSLEYDILPLLEENLTLHIKYDSSGALLIVAKGEMKSKDKLNVITERLHKGTRLRLPTVTTTNYSFDNRFFTRNIRSDHSKLKEELFMHGDWQVRSTQAIGNITGLFTAVYKGEFIIANTEEMLLGNLQTEDGDFPSDKEIFINSRQGNGWLNREAVLSILATHLPTLLKEEVSPLLSDLPETVFWSADRKGDLTTITLQPGD